MKEGTVKFFNNVKGFGFITPADGNTDIFVRTSGLLNNIQDNDRVSYEEKEGAKGMNAINVRVI